MTSALIVDFPSQRQRNRKDVRFSEATQLYIVDRHEDNDHKKELWYTRAEYKAMKLDIRREVLQARVNDAASIEDSDFWIGIAHLLTPAIMFEVRACRSQCMRAVLLEQARQGPFASASFRCENIALASLAETRKAVLRARMLGKLHQESI